MSKLMHGARAKVFVDGVLVGLFTNVSYAYTLDVQAFHVLGRYSPFASDTLAQEAVTVSASGYRVIGQGAHTAPNVPKLNELALRDYVTFEIIDREAPDGSPPICTVGQVRPTGYSSGQGVRSASELSISYIGLSISDEDGPNEESANAVPRL